MSSPSTRLTETRAAIVGDGSLSGTAFTNAYTAAADSWLSSLFSMVFADDDVALVATGGHGRGELAPQSDFDLLILHRQSLDADQAQRFWYPIWDSGVKLGHAVRTVNDTLTLARSDLATATSLLSCRHLCGNTQLSDQLREASRSQWVKDSSKWLPQLAQAVQQRHQSVIDIAYALEPDLKEGRGGLRDLHAIEWSLAAQGTDIGVDLDDLRVHYNSLLAARVELHRLVGRPGDTLRLQAQDDVAQQLGDASSDVLMGRIAAAARRIAWASDEHWYDVGRQPGRTKFKREKSRDVDLGNGLSISDRRIVLRPEVALDQLSVLRVARAAAEHDLRIEPATLQRLTNAPAVAEPWPVSAQELLIHLLAQGRKAIAVIETLDESDLWCRLIPEWEPNRCRPQRNAYHRFTVDRHLLEAVAMAAELPNDVQRQDLLLIGALLHDIGKGYPGDHTEVGMVLAQTIAERLGFDHEDCRSIVMLVEHHLLLPDIATRRDLEDPATIRWVAAQAGSLEGLHLLAALTQADSIATGPAAWGPWKAGLVTQLVERSAHVLDGGDVHDLTVSPERLAEQRNLIEQARQQGQPLILVNGDQLTVVCADRSGLFSRIAGTLAVCGLDVIEASAFSENGMVLDRFRVGSTFEATIPWHKVQSTLAQTLRGRFALESRLADRARTYRRTPAAAQTLSPRVRVLNEASDDCTVVEVTGPDRIGLLYRLTRALAELDLEIVHAKVATMGHDVVDAFYVRDHDGCKVTDPHDVTEVQTALMHAMSST